jgi:hypothetical protein
MNGRGPVQPYRSTLLRRLSIPLADRGQRLKSSLRAKHNVTFSTVYLIAVSFVRRHRNSCRTPTEHRDIWSSIFLAIRRSAVSKPSVNLPKTGARISRAIPGRFCFCFCCAIPNAHRNSQKSAPWFRAISSPCLRQSSTFERQSSTGLCPSRSAFMRKSSGRYQHSPPV